jgi:hypothetical protein
VVRGSNGLVGIATKGLLGSELVRCHVEEQCGMGALWNCNLVSTNNMVLAACGVNPDSDDMLHCLVCLALLAWVQWVNIKAKSVEFTKQ